MAHLLDVGKGVCMVWERGDLKTDDKALIEKGTFLFLQLLAMQRGNHVFSPPPPPPRSVSSPLFECALGPNLMA